MTVDICSCIAAKRDKKELNKKQIEFFIKGAADGSIPDYQLTALLMAIYLNGMTEKETVLLTMAMAKSGDTVDLSQFGNLTADKHSTGGVGDKTTLIAAPIAAACGVIVAKMSGRGLGFTGGTVDKFESVPEYNTVLSPKQFLNQVEQSKIAVIGQSGNLTPADKRLYALRDVTETVASIPLIASSIMSKKIAAGSHNIVLDVKVGSGAFMKTKQEAEKLAHAMIKIGSACGRNVSAVLTSMSAPLGKNVGNALEVAEAAEILKTGRMCDLTEVSLTLASEMVRLALELSDKEALNRVNEALKNGSGFNKLCELVRLQGGNDEYIRDTSLFEKAKNIITVNSDKEGFVHAVDAEKIGRLSVKLGAGRKKKGDEINPAAGIEIFKKPGDSVKNNEAIAVIHTDIDGIENEACTDCISAYLIDDKKPEIEPVILEKITGNEL